MESKNSLDNFLDELNEGAKSGQFITYTWRPHNHLMLQYGGKVIMRIIADTPEKSYEEMEKSLKALLRDKVKEYSDDTRVIWS